jgi:hypothetical protein
MPAIKEVVVDNLGNTTVEFSDNSTEVFNLNESLISLGTRVTNLEAAGPGGSGVGDGDKTDITVSSAGTVWTIDNNVVTNAKAADVPTATIKGRVTAGTGDPEDLTAAQVRTLLNVADGATPNATHTGDVTGATALTIANNAVTTVKIADDAVTNAKLANVATASIKGRATAGTGDVEDLTAAQVRTLLNVSNGATANSSDATLLNRANHTGTQAQSTVTNLTTDLAAKQATLVSGTNIKTVNGNTLLGTGDIVISGSAGTLNDLTDVTITTPSTGQVLKYNGSVWVNDTDAGGSSADTPVTLTGNTTLTWPAAQGNYYFINSASAVALTLPSGAITNASKIQGVNMGAGALSFVASGGDTIASHAILPTTVDQYSPFELRRFGTVWVRVA